MPSTSAGRQADHELQQLRRSIATLAPGAPVLWDREGALRVLADPLAAQKERDELRAKLNESGEPFE